MFLTGQRVIIGGIFLARQHCIILDDSLIEGSRFKQCSVSFIPQLFCRLLCVLCIDPIGVCALDMILTVYSQVATICVTWRNI